MLTVVFGTTLLATSTVLSAFMAGLALGSWVLGGTSTAASTRCGFLPRWRPASVFLPFSFQY